MAALRNEQQIKAAQHAYNAGDLSRAESLCRALLPAHKKDVKVLSLLGLIAKRRNERDEAISYFRQCVTLRPKAALGHAYLAIALSHAGRLPEALARLDRALKLDPTMPIIWAEKAKVHMLMGQHEKARGVLERAPARDLGLAGIAAEVELRAGNPAGTVAIAEPALAEADVPRDLQYRLGSILGRAHERLKDWDAAFRAYDRGNRALATDWDPERNERRVDEIIETFSAANLATLPRSRVDSPRPVFVFGMPRSGSTLVERIIATHPEAHGAGQLGVVFRRIGKLNWDIGSTVPFPQCALDLEQEDVDTIGREVLDELEGHQRSAARIVDKGLPHFLHLGLIVLLLPGARLIHTRRRPIDTCFSCFTEMLEPTAWPWKTDLRNLGAAYRAYARLMDHWREVGIEMLEVDYEEVVADQEGMSRRLLEHVGLEWDDSCLEFYKTDRKDVTLSFEQVRRPVYSSSVGRATHFAKQLAPLREALGPEFAPPDE